MTFEEVKETEKQELFQGAVTVPDKIFSGAILFGDASRIGSDNPASITFPKLTRKEKGLVLHIYKKAGLYDENFLPYRIDYSTLSEILKISIDNLTPEEKTKAIRIGFKKVAKRLVLKQVILEHGKDFLKGITGWFVRMQNFSPGGYVEVGISARIRDFFVGS